MSKGYEVGEIVVNLYTDSKAAHEAAVSAFAELETMTNGYVRVVSGIEPGKWPTVRVHVDQATVETGFDATVRLIEQGGEVLVGFRRQAVNPRAAHAMYLDMAGEERRLGFLDEATFYLGKAHDARLFRTPWRNDLFGWRFLP